MISDLSGVYLPQPLKTAILPHIVRQVFSIGEANLPMRPGADAMLASTTPGYGYFFNTALSRINDVFFNKINELSSFLAKPFAGALIRWASRCAPHIAHLAKDRERMRVL
jgi:hypothetical protein